MPHGEPDARGWSREAAELPSINKSKYGVRTKAHTSFFFGFTALNYGKQTLKKAEGKLKDEEHFKKG